PPFTASIAAIIKDEDIKTQSMKLKDARYTMSNIAAIAMTEQDGGIVLFAGDIPAIEQYVIRGLEFHILIIQSCSTGSVQNSQRMKPDTVTLEPADEAIEKKRDNSVENVDRLHEGLDTNLTRQIDEAISYRCYPRQVYVRSGLRAAPTAPRRLTCRVWRA